jgi:ABC-type sugar transport system ATPase subunit
MPPPTSPDPGSSESASHSLTLDRVSKSFGGVPALSDVSFTIRGGEVHALVGENGAGKSTLLKIVSGAHAPDSGRIVIDGHEVAIASPAHAAGLGIAIIYQELSLIPWLSVAQNLFLGREREVGRFIISRRRLRERAREILDRLSLDVDPDLPVALLGVATQQMVEIARALSQDARFLLMDEPTASLTDRETGLLFERIAALRAQGVSIAYISHRLEELPRIADRVTVLRDGAVAHRAAMTDTSLPEIVRAMVGRPLSDYFPQRSVRIGEEILRVAPPPARPRSRPVAVRAGEVVGVAGLVGAGRTEWLWRIFGAAPGAGETVILAGTSRPIRSPSEARDRGLGMVPESRKEHGLVLTRPVRDNATMTVWDRLRSRLGLMDVGRQTEMTQAKIRELRIRCPGPDAPVAALSGGNQQKVVLAKWLERDCRVLLLDEPTRGIDVGAKYEIYGIINKLAEEGKAIIVISSEMPELLGISDRIYVMNEGRFVAEMSAREATQEKIMRAIMKSWEN